MNDLLGKLREITGLLPFLSLAGLTLAICYAGAFFYIVGLELLTLLSWEDFLKFTIVGMLASSFGLLHILMVHNIPSRTDTKANKIFDDILFGRNETYLALLLACMGFSAARIGLPYTSILVSGAPLWMFLLLKIWHESQPKENPSRVTLLVTLLIAFTLSMGVVRGEVFLSQPTDKYRLNLQGGLIKSPSIYIISRGIIYSQRHKAVFVPEEQILSISRI